MTIAVSTGTTKGRANEVWGTRRVSVFQITLDNSYPTNGWAFDPKQFGHQGKVEKVTISPRHVAGAAGTFDTTFVYDHTAKKIFATVASTGVEVGNGVSKASAIIDVFVFSD